MKRKLIFILFLPLFFTACSFQNSLDANKSSKAYYYSGYKNKLSYLHTTGNKIIDEYGDEIKFYGLSWFGFETNTFAPHGLSIRNYKELIKQIKDLGFNSIRIPYCNQMFNDGIMPTAINYKINPELEGLKPIEVLDKIVEEAAKNNIRIILDRHRPDAGGQSELWYTEDYPESRWIDDWIMLTKRYKDNPSVVAFDLHNEPHGKASWGTGDINTDWRLAAQRAGNEILKINPKILIIVEGVEKNVKNHDNYYWWGGNLEGVKEFPVTLNVANQLIYSPHDYGEGVADQKWFHDKNFPENMPYIWDKMWGYISRENIAPILVGEFGGKKVDLESLEGKWQNAIVDYISLNSLSWTYWCLNPESGDTGGILKKDWNTVEYDKLELLDKIMMKKN